MHIRIVPITLIAASFALSLPANAAWSLGQGHEVFLTGDASIAYNDNIFLSNTGAKSDSIIDLAPGVLLTYGEGSVNTGEAGFVENIKFYSSNSGVNSNLAHAWANINHNDGKTATKGDISFTQLDQANIDVRGAGFLVRRDVFHAGLGADVDVSDKTVVSAGINYDNTEYKRGGYADWKWWEVPVKVYYKTTPKLELGGGITYKSNTLSAVLADSTEMFYNFRLRGEATPKLSGELAVGIIDRNAEVSTGDKTDLGLDTNWTFAATEKTLLNFGASNAFSTSGTGSSYTKFSLNGGVDITVSSELRAGANVSYSKSDYILTSQKDDLWTADLHASYLVNAFLSVTGSYTYTTNDSSIVGSGFKQNIFKVGASLKY